MSEFAISKIWSLTGVISLDAKVTVIDTFAVPSVITVGAKDVRAIFPVGYVILPTLLATVTLLAPRVLYIWITPLESCNEQPVRRTSLSSLWENWVLVTDEMPSTL